MEAYCLKCRQKVEIQNPKRVILSNGAPVLKGTCPVSGTRVCRFVKRRIGPIYAFELAIERERAAKEFYVDIANLTMDASGRSMFKWLAVEEAWHQANLESQLIARFQNLSAPIWEEETAPLNEDEFPGITEATGEYVPSSDEIEALRSALSSEEDSFNFYREMAENTTDPGGKTAFISLAVQEEGHFKLLKRQLERLANNRTYFFIARFSSITR